MRARAALLLLGVALSTSSADKKAATLKRQQILLDGLKNGCASGMATICCKTLLQPFDTIKTVQQSSTQKLSIATAAHQVVSQGGVGGLYRGLPIALFGSVPAMSTYWAAYQICKTALLDRCPNLPTMWIVAISSAAANSAASTLRVPCEVVKQRLQAGIYSSLLDAIRTLGASGVSGFYLPGALAAQLLRDIPFGVFTLCAFEALGGGATIPLAVVRWVQPSANMWRALCFALATSAATIATNPMDVLKTRVMTSRTSGGDGGWVRVAAHTWSSEGGAAFFRGALPRLLHKIPAAAVFFLLYEIFRAVLKVQVPPKKRRRDASIGASA